jgi:hypothetical protein
MQAVVVVVATTVLEVYIMALEALAAAATDL